jgi:intracellular sulfur oxidation DsrE/DsrF family protein
MSLTYAILNRYLNLVAVATVALRRSFLTMRMMRRSLVQTIHPPPVVNPLMAAGIEIAVCRQALLDSQVEPDWIFPEVTLALTALTALTAMLILQ